MTFNKLLDSKGISRYILAKQCGLSMDFLSDLYYGGISIKDCDSTVINKLAQALNIPKDDVLKIEPYEPDEDGTPVSKEYLETGLPYILQKALDDYKEGIRTNSTLLDCLWGELYGSINVCQIEREITKDHADYLRDKYLF